MSGSKGGKGFTRRDVVKKGAAFGAAAVIGAPAISTVARAAGPGDGKLYIRGVGGVLDELTKQHVSTPFTKETGIEVVTNFIPTPRILAVASTNGLPVDIANSVELVAVGLNSGGHLEKLDWSRFKADRNDFVRTTDYYVPLQISADVISFNTNKFGAGKAKAPESWADIWNIEGFPGRRVLQDAANGRPPIEIALLADGVAMKDLYPLDLDRAFRKLEQIKPHILKFFHSAGEHDQLYSSGLVDLGEGLSGRVGALATTGSPYAISWNQALKSPQCFTIIKGTKMLDAAYKWLDIAMRPDVQAKFVSPELMYGPGNRKALELTPPEWRKYLATTPEAEKASFFMDSEWWGKNLDEVLKRWQKFLT